MKTMILLTIPVPIESRIIFGYMAGAVIALFILVYLIYSLIKPEKF